MIFTNWDLKISTKDERQYMRPLFEFVFKQFIQIFGVEVFKNERCIVYNDTTAPYPMLIINRHPIEIRTSVKNLIYWASYIYHLSHELTHYVIRQYKPKKEVTIKWFEETLCEAMSLYSLKKASEIWNKCTLASKNPNYGVSLINFFNEIYYENSPSVLSQCHTLFDLQNIENDCENNRIARSIERNYLVNTFCEYPQYISSFVYYPYYIQGSLQIDFLAWKEKDPNPLISRLEHIQPKLVS